MPAALNVNREAVRTLVVAVGVREAARQMGIPESTVQAWSARGKWSEKVQQAQSVAIERRIPQAKRLQPSATKPADSLATMLADDRKATRIGFSKAARKVAEELAENDVASLTTPAKAIVASKWMGVAAGAQQWEEGKAATTMQLQILSVGGAMQVRVGQDQQQLQQ